MMNPVISISMAVVVAGAMTACSASAPIRLASQGRTEYALVPPADPTPMEQAAVEDLQQFLHQITGAEFRIDPNAVSPRIVMGQRAPGDARPFERRERRVRRAGDDVYLYGEGAFGTAFAVYDFLEHELGCRWYTLWGDMHIPSQPELVLDDIDRSVVPSFETFEAGSRNILMEQHPEIANFFRRRRIFFMPSYTEGAPDSGWHYVGPPIHAMSAYLPPGGHEPGRFANGWMGPHPLFADNAYFETNPEFFTMDESGRRVPGKLLCFSHPELRKTFTENLEKVIAHENYDPAVPGVISLDVNDKGGPFCACPECRVLVDRYDAIGGPYYDYLLELSAYFAKKYPRLVIRFLAYGPTMTEIPPALEALGEPFPDNLVPFFAALYADFSRPLNHPINEVSYTRFRNWSKVSRVMWLWQYPNAYPWPAWHAPPVAGGYRLAEDLRTAYALNTRMVLAEFGGSVIDNMGFKPLWIYLISRMTEDITLDENEVIHEFMEGVYGAAAPLMLGFFNELEAFQLRGDHYLRYNGDPRVLSYATPDTVLRWQADFDRMEARVRDDPARLLHVRRARLNIDAFTVNLWPQIRKAFPETTVDIDEIYARHVANLDADFEAMYADAPRTPEIERHREARFNIMKGGGIDRFYRLAQPPINPLPEAFAEEHAGRTIHRIQPSLNRRGFRATRQTPDADPDGAFGVAIRGRTTNAQLSFQTWERGENQRTPLEGRVLRQDLLADAPEGYRLYRLDRIRLTPDCLVLLRQPDGLFGLFAFGHLFDPDTPEKEYDLYAGLKFESPRYYRCDQMVLVEVAP